MAHQNNNAEVKYSERSDNQLPGNWPGNRVDDPRVRAPDKEKVAVSVQQNSGSNVPRTGTWRCYRCNGVGHMAKNCNRPKIGSAHVASSIGESMRSKNMLK